MLGFKFRFYKIIQSQNILEINVSYLIPSDKTQISNVGGSASADFKSAYISNQITYQKTLQIMSDVKPNDVVFNWNFGAAILIIIFGVPFLYAPIGFCCYFFQKKRFGKWPMQFEQGDKSRDISVIGKSRMEMIELRNSGENTQQGLLPGQEGEFLSNSIPMFIYKGT